MNKPDSNRPTVGWLYRPSPATARRGALRHRGPRVLMALHHDCAVCLRRRRRELERMALMIGDWGGRFETTSPVGKAPGPDAWLAVVDEWDRVFHVAHIEPGHTYPDPAELVEWVRFVAIQCEECEGPEGPWRP